MFAAFNNFMTGSFSPLSLGPSLWLSDTGSSAGQWDDLSGNGRHATQGTVGNQPTIVANALNGRQVRRFNGTNHFLSCGDVIDAGTGAITIYTVVKINNVSGLAGVVGKSRAAAGFGRYSILKDGTNLHALNSFRADGGSAGLEAVLSSDNNTAYRIIASTNPRSNGTTISTRLYVNAALAATSSGATGNISDINSTDFLLLGVYQNSTGLAPLAGTYLNGDIAEVLIFNADHDSTQRESVHRYLSQKYAIPI